jgi:hypothetical protein
MTQEPAPLSVSDMRDLIGIVDDSVSQMESGSKTASQVASNVHEELKTTLESALDDKGLLGLWEKTRQTFLDAKVQLQKSSPGFAVEKVAGRYKNAPSNVVAKVLENEKTLEDALVALQNTGKPELAAELVPQLQSEYIKQMGVNPGNPRAQNILKYDESIVDSLFGRNADGTPNGFKANRIKAAFEDINKVVGLKKIDLRNVAAEDMDSVLSALSSDERKEAIQILADRATAQGELENMTQNKLFAQVAKGNWELVDTDEFAKNALIAPSREFSDLFGKMPVRAQEGLKQDMVAQLFQKFASKQGAREAPNGVQLWDAPAVMEVVGNWTRGGKTPAPTLIKNLDTALGQDFTDAFVGASKTQALMPFKELAQDATFRSGIGGNGFWGSISLPIDATWNYVLAASYNKGLEPLLRGMARNLPQQELDKLAQRASNSAWKTTLGMKSLYQVSRNNPDASASLQEEFRKHGVQNIPANAIGEQK